MENLCKVDTVVLDKTGTLTEGVPVVTDSYWISDDNIRYLDVLYTAEQKSEHPLASAILCWLEESGAKVCEAEKFREPDGTWRTHSGRRSYLLGGEPGIA